MRGPGRLLSNVLVFACTVAISGKLLVLGGSARFGGTRRLRVVFGFPRVRALVANHNNILVVIGRHPRNEQVRVSTRNGVVDVEPDTVNMSRKIGVTSGLGGQMIANIVVLIL